MLTATRLFATCISCKIKYYSNHNYPPTIIILSFMLQYVHILHSSQITFYGTLAYRQYLRHSTAGYCRRLFYKIQYFLLTFSKFCVRQISDKGSAFRHVGRSKDNCLKLGWCRPEYRYNYMLTAKGRNNKRGDSPFWVTPLVYVHRKWPEMFSEPCIRLKAIIIRG